MSNRKKISALFLSLFALYSSHINAGPYVTAQVGAAEMSFRGRVGLGYLWDVESNVRIGVETGLQSGELGKAIDVLGVIEASPDRKISVFAKAGPIFEKEKSSSFVPKGVIGVGYNLTDKLNANISLSQEFEGTTETCAMVGLTYRIF